MWIFFPLLLPLFFFFFYCDEFWAQPLDALEEIFFSDAVFMLLLYIYAILYAGII